MKVPGFCETQASCCKPHSYAPLMLPLLGNVVRHSNLLCRCLFVVFSHSCRLRLKCDGTRAETRFHLSAKRTSPFKSPWMSVQSTTGSRVVPISGSNAGYTMFRGSVRVLATHCIRKFPLHFPSRVSPCAITFQLDCNTMTTLINEQRLQPQNIRGQNKNYGF